MIIWKTAFALTMRIFLEGSSNLLSSCFQQNDRFIERQEKMTESDII